MMTPHAFARDFILRWEDGGSTDPQRTHSLDPVDNGNWTGGRQGAGALVGSNHGVTPATLASHRGLRAASITRPMMAALSLDEAADIALRAFYLRPRLDLLPWGPVTASIFDFGWGSGPGQAIKLIQRRLGVEDDGRIGPVTARAFADLLAAQGDAVMAGAWWTIRDAFYAQIIEARPANARFRKGWMARSLYFTPGDGGGWWARFAAEGDAA